ncbi:MAG: ribosome biogenesis GTPase Der, partial [Gammaproteobacteria bacterium]|nr:ribosome biogenesis GTPase Der [Gammaproteobacteria bacterium]
MSILPVVAIAGRPNVGKSTLFNCLTRRRDALVGDEPGVTRDRIYAVAEVEGRRCLLVDTGGLSPDADVVGRLVHAQAERAIAEADVVLFVVDARDGLTPDDESVADRLRRSARDMILVVNKVDGLDPEIARSDFHRLGIDRSVPVSAAHRGGIGALAATIVNRLPPPQAADAEQTAEGTRVCILGRPNVGKSTLINRAVGEERVLAHETPGTTRDSIAVPFVRKGRGYTLIDTAGVRRRAKVAENVEKFS